MRYLRAKPECATKTVYYLSDGRIESVIRHLKGPPIPMPRDCQASEKAEDLDN